MAVGPSTTKLLDHLQRSEPGLNAFTNSQSFALERVKLSDVDHLRDIRRERRTAALQESQEIARSEMARRRRRLSNLTPEQESTIETLPISTVNRVSEMVMAVRESLDGYPIEKKEKVNVAE